MLHTERGQQTVSKPQKDPARNRSGGPDERSEELICLAEEHGGHRAQGPGEDLARHLLQPCRGSHHRSLKMGSCGDKKGREYPMTLEILRESPGLRL